MGSIGRARGLISPFCHLREHARCAGLVWCSRGSSRSCGCHCHAARNRRRLEVATRSLRWLVSRMPVRESRSARPQLVPGR